MCSSCEGRVAVAHSFGQYFTLSGLKTNLGLLDNGITWGYVVLLCVVAFASKFFACAGAAFAMGFNWREAGAMGSLMSCKGYAHYYSMRFLAHGVT